MPKVLRNRKYDTMEEKLRRLAECPFSFVKGWAKVLETRAPSS